MAKISARGATKVESITTTIDYPARDIDGIHLEGFTSKYTHTLCSDGRILRKTDLDPYRKVAKVSVSAPDPVATFRAYVRRFEAARS